jgi:hypothetical protein
MWEMAAAAIPSILSYIGNERTNSANAALADKQMDFQERMSNTSYQRAVADLQSAGLNPMLAYSRGGASTPQGAMATMTNSAESGVRAYTSTALLQAQKDNIQAQTVKTAADTDLSKSQTKLTDMKTLTEANVPPLLAAQTVAALGNAAQSNEMVKKINAEIPLLNANLNKVNQEIDNLVAQLAKTKQDTSTSFALDVLYRKQANLTDTLNGLNLVRTTLTGEQVGLTRAQAVRETRMGNIAVPTERAALTGLGSAAAHAENVSKVSKGFWSIFGR